MSPACASRFTVGTVRSVRAVGRRARRWSTARVGGVDESIRPGNLRENFRFRSASDRGSSRGNHAEPRNVTKAQVHRGERMRVERVRPDADIPTCFHCGEAIVPSDDRIRCANGPVAHGNCFLRCVIGSVAHLLRKCRCFVPGSILRDPEGMSRRQAADAAVIAWKAQQGARSMNGCRFDTVLIRGKKGDSERVVWRRGCD